MKYLHPKYLTTAVFWGTSSILCLSAILKSHNPLQTESFVAMVLGTHKNSLVIVLGICVLELVLAGWLASGKHKVYAAIASAAVILVYTLILGLVYYRASDVECGCFGGLIKTSAPVALFRNVIMMLALIATIPFLYSRPKVEGS